MAAVAGTGHHDGGVGDLIDFAIEAESTGPPLAVAPADKH